jgi:hypothetical protein
MTQALAALPPSRWQESHLPAVKAIITATLNARDASTATMQACISWLLSILPFHPGFAIGSLPDVIIRSGSFAPPRLQDRLSDLQIEILGRALLPVLATWQKRDQLRAIFALLRAFGHRLRASPVLTAFLEGLTADERGAAAGPAMQMIATHPLPGQMNRLVPALLQADPSWITQPSVYDYLHATRQDLLNRFLIPNVYGGRFSTADASFLPRYRGGFSRWTADQQTTYADGLLFLARSGKRAANELWFAINTMGELPAISEGRLVQLASRATEDTALRDKALEALGRLDGGRGVPTLIEALEDERARVAIYALRHAILAMPASRALPLLKAAPREKIAVAKEVLRLAGEVPGEAAFSFLMQFAAKPDLHTDIRIALLRSLWQHRNKAEVWTMFAQAARDPIAAIARATIAIPATRLNVSSIDRLVEHMALLLRHESAQVSYQTVMRLAYQPLGRCDASLNTALAARLSSAVDHEQGLAARALIEMNAPGNSVWLVECFGAIHDPLVLATIVAQLIAFAQQNLSRIAPTALSLATHLFAERRQIGLAVRLMLATQPLEAVTSLLHTLDADGLLHPGAVLALCGQMRQAMYARNYQPLLDMEASLRIAAQPSLRRTGLAILEAQTARLGWNEATREALTIYQHDSDPWVQETAGQIKPVETRRRAPPPRRVAR